MITFFAPGLPAGQGSKRHVGNGIMIDTCKRLKPWRSVISLKASEMMAGNAPLSGPLMAEFNFYFPRPKHHFSKDGRLKDNAPIHHFGHRDDLDKLCRAVMDSLSKIVFEDDGLVVFLKADKTYQRIPGVQVTVVNISERNSGF